MLVGSLKPELMRSAATTDRTERRPSRPLYVGAMAAAFIVAYIPTYVQLFNGPWQTEQEGHGPLIMLAAAWLAWQQRGKLSHTVQKPAWLIDGWIVLIVSLLVMAVARSQDVLMVETFTQIPVLLGCVLLIGGWPLARVFAFRWPRS